MFGFKRKKKERRQPGKFWKMMGDVLSPVTSWLDSKLRIRGRIRLLNQWATRNPKRMFAYYCILGVILLSLNVLTINFHNATTPFGGYPELSKVEQVFDRNREMERTHNLIHSVETEYATANYYLVDRLDSLLSVRSKTHADSVEIVRIYNKLNYLKNIHP